MLNPKSQVLNAVRTMRQDPRFRDLVEDTIASLIRQGLIKPGTPLEESLFMKVDETTLAEALLAKRDSVNDQPDFVQGLQARGGFFR